MWNDICKEEYKANRDNFMQSNHLQSNNQDTNEFTFNNLFQVTEEEKVKILIGFMEYLGIHEIQQEDSK